MIDTVRVSSFCHDGGCVEVRFLHRAGGVIVGATNAPGTLYFTGDEWAAFVAGVKAGEFDHPGGER